MDYETKVAMYEAYLADAETAEQVKENLIHFPNHLLLTIIRDNGELDNAVCNIDMVHSLNTVIRELWEEDPEKVFYRYLILNESNFNTFFGEEELTTTV